MFLHKRVNTRVLKTGKEHIFFLLNRICMNPRRDRTHIDKISYRLQINLTRKVLLVILQAGTHILLNPAIPAYFMKGNFAGKVIWLSVHS